MTKEHAYAYEAGYQDGLKAANAEKATLLQRLNSEMALVKSLGEQLKTSQMEKGELREQFERDRKDYQATVDSLVDECAELEKENAGLKRWREHDSGHVDIGGIEVIETGSRLLTAEDVAELTTHIERLEAENAKLRKLASEMRWCLNDKCRWCQKFGTSCSTERDRQKLGIEVVA